MNIPVFNDLWNKFVIIAIRTFFRILVVFWKQSGRKALNDVERILIVTTTAIGDTVMATPAIRAIRKRYPDAFLAALADRRRFEILLDNPNLDGVFVYHGKFKKLLRLVSELRRYKFDLTIILHGNDPDIVPISYVTGAQIRVGWAESKLSFLLTKPVKRAEGMEHSVDHKLRILKEIDIEPDGKHSEIFFSPEDKEYYHHLAGKYNIDEGDLLIGIHTFGSRPAKWWSLHRMAELGDQLFDKYNARLILFGGAKEKERYNEVLPLMKGSPLVLSGHTSLKESAYIIKRCNLFITTDSGPMHLSFAVGTPTICLFGPENASIFGPYFNRDRNIVIQKEVDCNSHCKIKRCDHHLCMDKILVSDVLTATHEIIGG